MRISDWSSDVCSSDLTVGGTGGTCYAPGLTWNYWPPANQMFRTAPLAAGAVATFVYTVQFPQVITVQDAAEVALRGVWQTQRTVTPIFDRSEVRRVGKEWVSPGRSRWSQYQSN